MAPKIIVALDYNHLPHLLTLVDTLDPNQVALKIGSEAYTLWGPECVKTLVARQFNVFLDLKFHDIPNTVAQACAAAADLGVWMVNVHASGGLAMMKAAREALSIYGDEKPLLIAVTVLTSFSQEMLSEVGIESSVQEQVVNLARLAQNAGLDGVVSSAHEVQAIKSACGALFNTVTPGIRLATTRNDDQVRIMTPKAALDLGSDYLVIGRPITQAVNPQAVIEQILKDISS